MPFVIISLIIVLVLSGVALYFVRRKSSGQTEELVEETLDAWRNNELKNTEFEVQISHGSVADLFDTFEEDSRDSFLAIDEINAAVQEVANYAPKFRRKHSRLAAAENDTADTEPDNISETDEPVKSDEISADKISAESATAVQTAIPETPKTAETVKIDSSDTNTHHTDSLNASDNSHQPVGPDDTSVVSESNFPDSVRVSQELENSSPELDSSSLAETDASSELQNKTGSDSAE
ncbi:hypothetical protein RQN30_11435 [Arcanobacterium hippocoleae]